MLSILALAVSPMATTHKIDRKQIVQTFNPRRNESAATTPLQVGNGNSAFGVDATGLQTFNPFATMASEGG